MEINYLCPKCRSYLNIGTKVVFSIHVKNNQKGLVLFEKELGDYNIKKNNLIEYEEGEELGFFCPICHEDLVAEISPNLAKVIMADDDDNEFEILFSRIAGEQATYKLKSGKIETYGKNKDKYLHLFNQ